MLFMRGSGLLLQMTITVLLVRNLSADQYGSYVYVISLLSLTLVPLCSAIMQLVTRVASSGLENGSDNVIRWFKRRSIISITALMLIYTIYLVFLGDFTLFNFGLLLCVGAMPIASFMSGLFSGHHKVVVTQFYEQILRPMSTLASLIIISAVGYKYFYDFLFGYLISIVFSAFIFAIYAFNSFRNKIQLNRVASSISSHSEYDKSLFFLTISAFSTYFLVEVNVIIMKYYNNLEGIGVYNLAMKLAGLIGIVNVATSQLVNPNISKLFSEKSAGDLNIYIKQTTRINFAITMVLSIFLLLFKEELIAILFGKQYVEKLGFILPILIASHLINIAFGPVVRILIMTGNERFAVLVLLLTGGLVGVISVLILPALGVLGAVYAYAFGVIFWNVAMNLSIRKKIGITPGLF